MGGGNGGGNICSAIYCNYPPGVRQVLPNLIGSMGLGALLVGVFYLCSAMLTLLWIRQQRRNALRGIEGAAKHVIFPIYRPVMLLSALSDVLVGVVLFLVNPRPGAANDWWCVVGFAAAVALQHFLLEGIALLLMQYGCGLLAVRRAALMSGLWAIFTFCCVIFVFKEGAVLPQVNFLVYLLWNTLLWLFYLVLWLTPTTVIFRRPAARFYAQFFVVYESMVMVGVLMQALGNNKAERAIGDCLYLAGAIPFFVLFKPFVLYHTLLMDSRWWQGLTSASAAPPPTHAVAATAVGPNRTDYAPPNTDVHTNRTDGKLKGVSSNSDLSSGSYSNAAGNSNDGQSRSTSGEASHPRIRQKRTDRYSYSYHYSEGSDGEGYYSPVRIALSAAQQAVNEQPDAGNSDISDRMPSSSTGAEKVTKRSLLSRILFSNVFKSNKSKSHSEHAAYHQGRNGQLNRQLTGPLSGIEVGFSEAQALAGEVDSIRRHGQVKLLNFAYLALDAADSGSSKALLGSGSFSKVYRGTYKQHKVAVKMLFTQDLNPEVIRRCSNEARILSAIGPHTNVVEIFGVAVLPPSVCLVLEVCEYGSLADVLRGSLEFAANQQAAAVVAARGSAAAGRRAANINRGRPPLCLSYADRMFLALGCCRGLQALHSYSPTLCHRDIKSFNFLIDAQLNAKIADLDLGQEGRYVPVTDATAVEDHAHSDSFGESSEGTEESMMSAEDSSSLSGSRIVVADDIALAASGEPSATDDKRSADSTGATVREPLLGLPPAERRSVRKRRHRRHGGRNRPDSSFVVGGSNMCIFWQAPEVLRGETYTQKSDLHSLALVLWEIVSAGKRTTYVTTPGKSSGGSSTLTSSVSYGSHPYAECKTQLEVRNKILSGERPYIQTTILGSSGAVPSSAQASSPRSKSAARSTGGSGMEGNVTCGLSRAIDEQLEWLIRTGWSEDPDQRPSIEMFVQVLEHCWHQSLHSIIMETPHIVDLQKVEEENFRMTILQDDDFLGRQASNGSSRRLRSSTAVSGSTTLPDRFTGSTITSGAGNSSSGLKSSTAGMMVSTGGLAAGFMNSSTQLRQPPSPAVLATLLQMQSEPRWARLEDEGAFLIVSPRRPFFMLWATRRWTQLTGYLVNECIAHNISTLLGPQSNFGLFDRMLCDASESLSARHLMMTIYRCDGRPLSLSTHIYPIYRDNGSSEVREGNADLTLKLPSSSLHQYGEREVAYIAVQFCSLQGIV